MTVITKITVQQKNTDRYNIFLDEGNGEKYAFSVDEDVLIKFNLKKGMQLDEFILSEIQYADDIRKALNMSIQQLARRMRSEGEIRQFLRKKSIVDPVINEVVHKLTQMNYLDDAQFSQAYVQTQIKTTDKGPDVIRRELQEKEVADKWIEKSLSEFPQEEQVDKAVTLAEKYINKNKRDSKRILIQKVKQMLIRKGYDTAVISIALEEVPIQKEEQEWEALKLQGERAHRRYVNLQHQEYYQKMKQTLYRKGFSLEMIIKYLEEKRND